MIDPVGMYSRYSFERIFTFVGLIYVIQAGFEMEPEYYRTFIALPVRPGKELLSVVERLRKPLAGERISWVRPENFHFTLRFLGDTPVDQVRLIGHALRSGIHALKFQLRMTAPAIFGPRKRPRVLYIGTEPSKELDELHHQVETILTTCGLPPSDQPFRAHLTLGRIRSLRNFKNLDEALEGYQETALETLLMDRMVYFRSELGPGGPVYSKITEIAFN